MCYVVEMYIIFQSSVLPKYFLVEFSLVCLFKIYSLILSFVFIFCVLLRRNVTVEFLFCYNSFIIDGGNDYKSVIIITVDIKPLDPVALVTQVASYIHKYM